MQKIFCIHRCLCPIFELVDVNIMAIDNRERYLFIYYYLDTIHRKNLLTFLSSSFKLSFYVARIFGTQNNLENDWDCVDQGDGERGGRESGCNATHHKTSTRQTKHNGCVCGILSDRWAMWP